MISLAQFHSCYGSQTNSIERVQEVVAQGMGICKKDLVANRRHRFTVPRYIAIYLCYTLLELPVDVIAEKFGYRTGSSVTKAVKSVRSGMNCDCQFALVVNGLEQAVRASLKTYDTD